MAQGYCTATMVCMVCLLLSYPLILCVVVFPFPFFFAYVGREFLLKRRTKKKIAVLQ